VVWGFSSRVFFKLNMSYLYILVLKTCIAWVVVISWTFVNVMSWLFYSVTTLRISFWLAVKNTDSFLHQLATIFGPAVKRSCYGTAGLSTRLSLYQWLFAAKKEPTRPDSSTITRTYRQGWCSIEATMLEWALVQEAGSGWQMSLQYMSALRCVAGLPGSHTSADGARSVQSHSQLVPMRRWRLRA